MKRYAVKAEAVPLFAGVLALFASCEHKDLCFDHEEHALKSEVLIKAVYEKEWEHTCNGGPDWKNYEDWEEDFGMEYDSLLPVNPDGLRVQVYNEDGTNNVLNIAPGGGIVQMRPGEHSLLLYNNDTEYIVFDDMNSYAEARATTRTRTRSTYMGNSYMESDNEENTVSEPDMLYGNMGGSLGEVAAIALLIGFAYMLLRKIITWHIPVAIFATVIVFTGILHLANPEQFAGPLFHLFTGGLMLGAIFMATDYVTSPMTHKGMWIYGIGIGVLTVLIRVFGSYPEGMSFAILIMNGLTPLINRCCKPQKF